CGLVPSGAQSSTTACCFVGLGDFGSQYPNTRPPFKGSEFWLGRISIRFVDREPQGARARSDDPMRSARGEPQIVPGAEAQRRPFDFEERLTAEQDHPFVVILVVEIASRRLGARDALY